MTGKIKSYLHNRQVQFKESKAPPICLGDINGRIYYAFSHEATIPPGGKTVTKSEHQTLKVNSDLIKQVKAEAMRRILSIAPYWKQNNALADLYALNNKADLTDEEALCLDNAKQLWATIQHLRKRSNDIEAALLQGEAIDYMQDVAWEEEPAQAQVKNKAKEHAQQPQATT